MKTCHFYLVFTRILYLLESRDSMVCNSECVSICLRAFPHRDVMLRLRKQKWLHTVFSVKLMYWHFCSRFSEYYNEVQLLLWVSNSNSEHISHFIIIWSQIRGGVLYMQWLDLCSSFLWIEQITVREQGVKQKFVLWFTGL